jgi:hypothetical protein
MMTIDLTSIHATWLNECTCDSVKELETSLSTLTETQSADTESRITKLLADISSSQRENSDIRAQMVAQERYSTFLLTAGP